MQNTKPNAEQLLKLEHSMNAIRDEVITDLGDRDAKYIHKIIRIQRSCEISGRLLLMFGFYTLGTRRVFIRPVKNTGDDGDWSQCYARSI
jgi:hypothetical protein